MSFQNTVDLAIDPCVMCGGKLPGWRMRMRTTFVFPGDFAGEVKCAASNPQTQFRKWLFLGREQGHVLNFCSRPHFRKSSERIQQGFTGEKIFPQNMTQMPHPPSLNITFVEY